MSVFQLADAWFLTFLDFVTINRRFRVSFYHDAWESHTAGNQLPLPQTCADHCLPGRSCKCLEPALRLVPPDVLVSLLLWPGPFFAVAKRN